MADPGPATLPAPPPSPRRPATFLQCALFAIMSAIWGSSYFFTKVALRSFAPMTIVLLRMGIAALILGGVMAIARTSLPRQGAIYRKLAVVSLVNITLPYTMITWGQQYVSASLTSILSSTTPLFVFAIATLVLKDEGFTWVRQCGTLIAFAGIFYLFAGTAGAHGRQSSVLGELVIVASSVVFAVGNVYSRRATGNVAPLVAAFLQLGFGCAFEAPLNALSGRASFGPAGPHALVAVLWLGVMGTALTYLLYFYFLRTWGSTRTSMNTYIQPVVGVTLGVTVLGDSLTGHAAVAAAITCAGVVTFAVGSRSAAR